ncbi:MAG: PilT/PilU family type 4a pilus ATPase [Acidimicrobiia bacterium]
MTTAEPERQIAEALVDMRLVTSDDVTSARSSAEAGEGNVLELLVRGGRLRRIDALRAMADHLGVQFFDPAFGFVPDPDAISYLEPGVAVSEVALPLRVRGDGVLVVAVADPLDLAKRDRLKVAAHGEVELALAPEEHLDEAVRRVYFAQPGAGESGEQDAPGVRDLVSAAPAEATYHVNDLLNILLDRGGSDLHLSAGSPPQIRLNGVLTPVDGFDTLRPAELRAMVYDLLSARQREKLEEKLELDISHPVAGRGRFRTNVFFQRGSVGAVMRAVPNRIASLEELGMPAVLEEFVRLPRGLVLITGATGSGKSTTLASMIDLINSERSLHIVTVEDPIEFVHSHRRSIVNQREVGADTLSFASALRHVLRQDPDVILVGEMRDLETISTALTAAETGHLVLATLHTSSAAGSIERVIDVFPAHQQQQVRVQLAESLRGVVSQQLIPAFDGHSRVPAVEVLVATPAVRNLIREGKVPQITSAMQAGGQHGMQTMDAALAELVRKGKVSRTVAAERAQSADDFANLVGGIG